MQRHIFDDRRPFFHFSDAEMHTKTNWIQWNKRMDNWRTTLCRFSPLLRFVKHWKCIFKHMKKPHQQQWQNEMKVNLIALKYMSQYVSAVKIVSNSVCRLNHIHICMSNVHCWLSSICMSQCRQYNYITISLSNNYHLMLFFMVECEMHGHSIDFSLDTILFIHHNKKKIIICRCQFSIKSNDLRWIIINIY